MEHVTYPNPDRVGRCEFAVKTILGLALMVPCLVVIPREGTLLRYKVAALIIVSFALYMSILWIFLIARRLHDFGLCRGSPQARSQSGVTNAVAWCKVVWYNIAP